MNTSRLMTILKAPHVSEKGTLKTGQHIFKVVKDATKPEIKAAVEHIFNVKVKNVRICNMKGKPARFGHTMGRRKDWKKAYITLHEGEELEIAS